MTMPLMMQLATRKALWWWLCPVMRAVFGEEKKEL
jgi:hypothetical protein